MRKTTRSAVDGLREFLFLLTTSPAFENSHSLATDVAGIQRYVRAAAATPGNLLARSAHQVNSDDVWRSEWFWARAGSSQTRDAKRIRIDAPSLAEASSNLDHNDSGLLACAEAGWTEDWSACWLVPVALFPTICVCISLRILIKDCMLAQSEYSGIHSTLMPFVWIECHHLKVCVFLIYFSAWLM